MSEIKLHIPRKLEQECRDWCRRWFPREAYGLLIGTFLGDSVHVDAIWTPCQEDGEECFKPGKIFFKGAWVAEVIDEHCDDGLRIVGDFHSHPYKKTDTRFDPVQSILDVGNTGGYPIYGVCNVEETLKGKLITHLKWWGPSIKINVVRRKDGNR